MTVLLRMAGADGTTPKLALRQIDNSGAYTIVVPTSTASSELSEKTSHLPEERVCYHNQ